MKQLLSIIIICLSVLSCAETNTEKQDDYNTKYYRNLAFRESPYADIRGIIELDEKAALKSFHYKIEYDDKGKIIKVSQKIGAKNAVWQPDQNRFFVKSSIVKIEYSNDEELRMYLDHNSELFFTKSGVAYERFKTNSDGNRVSLEYLDKDKKPIQNDWGIQRYTWETTMDHVEERRYDSLGNIVPMRPQLNFYHVKLVYDKTGYCEKFSNHDEN